ncbi:hypothetical protein T265_10048 [Opisthorchis viverrini]|uniref:Uncharacterized protein n=1 Tax=Opisthorchis viverrini TaxID=6198 RepID=A0A075A2T9_OPIVI|nr:hypothetical protein T265_10048 [Opisthorchis viverrini]KER21679.1 hypothetical protein T265_10048 [Opisthorchis viverrini]
MTMIFLTSQLEITEYDSSLQHSCTDQVCHNDIVVDKAPDLHKALQSIEYPHLLRLRMDELINKVRAMKTRSCGSREILLCTEATEGTLLHRTSSVPTPSTVVGYYIKKLMTGFKGQGRSPKWTPVYDTLF